MTRPWPEGLRWREIRSVGHFVVVEPDSSRGFVAVETEHLEDAEKMLRTM